MDFSGNLAKKLVEGDILLVSERGLKHAINRALGRSRWHHVMLYVGRGRVIEATPKKGCHISKLDLSKDCYIGYKALRNRRLTMAQRRKLVRTAISSFYGKKFSWMQLGMAGLRAVFGCAGNGRMQIARGSHDCNTERIICSNMIAIAYYKLGHPISRKYLPEYVMPRDYDRLEAAGKFEVVFEIRRKSGSDKNAA